MLGEEEVLREEERSVMERVSEWVWVEEARREEQGSWEEWDEEEALCWAFRSAQSVGGRGAVEDEEVYRNTETQ